MFRAFLGFVLFVFVLIVLLAVLFSMPAVLFGREDQYQELNWGLLLPPAFSLLYSIFLLNLWGRNGFFAISFFTGLILLALAAAYVVAEWPRVHNLDFYDLSNWPTHRNFVVFGRFLTIFVIEYSGIAFIVAALLHESLNERKCPTCQSR